LLMPASQAAAQSSDVCFVVTFGDAASTSAADCYEWTDYSYDTYGTDGTIDTDETAIGTNYTESGSGAQFSRVDIHVNVPEGCVAESSVLDWRRDDTTNYSYLTYDETTEIQNQFCGGCGSTSGWVTDVAFWGDELSDVYFVTRIQVYERPPAQIYVDNLRFTCPSFVYEPPGGIGDGLVQPIKEADQVDVFHGLAESGLIISDSSIIATDASNIIADAAKAPYVYSSITGTVTEIIPYNDGTFVVKVNGSVDGEEHEVTYSNLTDINVLTGDEITQGCVIGKAGPLIRHYESNEVLFEIHYSIVNLDVESTIPGLANYQNWTLYASPTGNTPCGDNFSGTCLNQNPAFDRNGQYWYGEDNAAGESPDFGEGGVIMPAGSAVKQDIEISSLSTFTITVGAAATTDTGVSLTIQLGDDGTVIALPGGRAVQVSQADITPAIPNIEPDLFTLTIRANRPTKLVYACLQDEDSATAPPPSACLLTDYSLETGDGWTFTDDAEIVETPSILGVNGTRLEIPLLGDASQTISLDGYDDHDAVYNITVEAAVPWSLNTGDYGVLSVGYEPTDPDFDQTSFFDIKPTLLPQTYTDQWTIPEGASSTGDFVLNVPLVYGAAGIVLVYEVCIAPADGYWPGQPEIPSSESDILCSKTIAFESENVTDIISAAKWIVSGLTWVGKFLDISIECNVARLRETMLRLLDPVLAWIRMIGKWLYFSIARFVAWAMNIIAYVMAILRNVLNSIINAIWTALIGTAFFQGAFDNLDLVSTVIATLIDLVLQIVGFIGRIVNVLSTLAQVIAVFWSSIVSAFNDPTIADTGMPICDGILEADPGYLMCVGLDLFDYVVNAFPSLNVLGLVGIGAIALFTIKKLSERFGDAFGQVA
jgi:hypothetical protein